MEQQVTVYREEAGKVLYRMLPDALPFRSFGLPTNPEEEKKVIARSLGITLNQLNVSEHIKIEVEKVLPIEATVGEPEEVSEDQQPEVQEAPKKVGKKKG